MSLVHTLALVMPSKVKNIVTKRTRYGFLSVSKTNCVDIDMVTQMLITAIHTSMYLTKPIPNRISLYFHVTSLVEPEKVSRRRMVSFTKRFPTLYRALSLAQGIDRNFAILCDDGEMDRLRLIQVARYIVVKCLDEGWIFYAGMP